MTVKELINILKSFDENILVKLDDSEFGIEDFCNEYITVEKSDKTNEDYIRISGYVYVNNK